MFEAGNEQIDAYVYPNCEIRVAKSGEGDRLYRETLDNVYIPFKKISANRQEADFSRLGLDFLEKFKIRFETLDLDRDQLMILQYPHEKYVKII